MNKELSDAAWRVLPSEFKEEVKYEYNRVATKARKDKYDLGFMHAHEGMFGIHNLTSDAEGEEILTVSRKNVLRMYSYNEEELTKDPTNKGALLLKLRLDALFGSKCLPDNVDSLEPKPAELKYQVNDKVKVKGTNRIGTIIEPYSNDVGYRVYFNDGDGGEDAEYSADELIPYENPKFKRGDMVIYKRTGKKKVVFGMDKYGRYMVALPNMQSPIYVNESDLEPYTEPEDEHKSDNTAQKSANVNSNAQTCMDDCPSQGQYPNPMEMIDHIVQDHEMVDNIIKDGFREHNRLHIAAILAAGMLASEVRCYPVDRALELADKLIAECEKGDNNA